MYAQNPSQIQSNAANAILIPINRRGALAPGLRFHPTDDELVNYYLKRKVCKKPLHFNAIADLDIYKVEPWELAEKSSLKTMDQEWYFFTPLDKKYSKSARPNRSTKQGYWKVTGKVRPIWSSNQIVATKKILVFHNGRSPSGERTNWIMHEYRLASSDSQRAASTEVGYALCRVFHKRNTGLPSRSCYASFVEVEWDDEETGMDDNAEAGEIGADKDVCSLNKQNNLSTNDVPAGYQQALILREEDLEIDRPTADKRSAKPPFPLIHRKRRCLNDGSSSSNGLENSLRATKDCSTMKTADTRMTSTANAATASDVSTVLTLSLPQPVALKESTPVLPSTPDAAAYLQSSLPPSCTKLIHDQQCELQKMSAEKENLRLELMSTQAMVNVFQYQIDCLRIENTELKNSYAVAK